MKEGYYLISNLKKNHADTEKGLEEGKWKVLAHWRPQQLSGRELMVP